MIGNQHTGCFSAVNPENKEITPAFLDSQAPSDRTSHKPGAVLLLAIGTFFYYLYIIFVVLPPYQLNKYFLAAHMIIQKSFPIERFFDFSMTYLTLHVIVQKLFANPKLVIQLIQVLFITLSTLFLFGLLRRFFQYHIALIGAIIYPLSYAVVVHTQAFEPESSVLFFLTGFLYFIHRNTWWSILLAGTFFGLGFLTRPTFMLVFFAVLLFFIINQTGSRKWMKSTVLFALPFFLCFFVLVVRNFRLLGEFCITTMNPGVAFFDGNNPNGQFLLYAPLVNEMASQTTGQPDYQHVVYRVFARKISGRELSVPEVNSYWAGKARNYVADYPARFFRYGTLRLFHFFHAYEWHDVWNTYWNQKKLARSLMPTLPFGIISALAILGLFLQLKNWRRSFLLYSVLASQAVVSFFVYVSSRHRVAAIPLFIFFACASLQYATMKRFRFRILIIAVPICIAMFLRTDRMKEEDHLWKGFEQSNRFLAACIRSRDSGNLESASRLASQALAAAPWIQDSRRPLGISFGPEGFIASALPHVVTSDFSGRFDRADLEVQAGNLDNAERTLNALISEGHTFKRDIYQSSEPSYYLGLISLKRGDQQTAVRFFRHALDRSPGDPSALSCLYALTGQALYNGQLYRYFDEIDADFYLGKAYLECGTPVNAVEKLTAVIDRIPNFRRGLLYLAVALGKSGRIEEAASRYKEAVRLGLSSLSFESEIIFVFRQAAEKSPADSEKQHDLGLVLRQYGHYEEAYEAQKNAFRLDPHNGQAKKEIELLEKLLPSRGDKANS